MLGTVARGTPRGFEPGQDNLMEFIPRTSRLPFQYYSCATTIPYIFPCSSSVSLYYVPFYSLKIAHCYHLFMQRYTRKSYSKYLRNVQSCCLYQEDSSFSPEYTGLALAVNEFRSFLLSSALFCSYASAQISYLSLPFSSIRTSLLIFISIVLLFLLRQRANKNFKQISTQKKSLLMLLKNHHSKHHLKN